MLSHTIENRPAISHPIPERFGNGDPVHHNDVLANRAIARRLWNMISRSPLTPHFPNHRNARVEG